jgi:hypothetical protein
MLYTFENTLSDKQTRLKSDEELMEFVNKIADENGDEEFILDNPLDCVCYIVLYCDNLRLIDKDIKIEVI